MSPPVGRYVGAVAFSVFVPLAALVITAQAGLSQDIDPGRSESAKVQAAYAKLPLSFIQNDGQVDKKVKFYEKGSGHATFFTKDGVYLSFTKAQSASAPTKPDATPIKLMPLGANAHPQIVAEGLQEGRVNHIIGNNPKQWKTNIPTYQAVVYQNVYPGIDMKFYGNNRQMEYDIIVKPGADPSKVTLAYEGIDGLQVTDEGDLEIATNGGTFRQNKPVIYQEFDGKRVEVAGAFTIEAANRKAHRWAYGFQVASYDRTHPLVIDPTLVYSTYLGGSGSDVGSSIAVDSAGNAYVTGTTPSTDFPTVTPLQAVNAGGINDAFIAKINAAGTALVYSTYLGGGGNDAGAGIAVDSAGNAYVTGLAGSTDFPTINSIQNVNRGGNDAFVAKLDSTGSLVYSTYLGGSGLDVGSSIAVDSAGNAYVTGSTGSACLDFGEFCFPTTPGAYQTSFIGGLEDAFVTKINADGTAFVYSTHLGTPSLENGLGIAVDAAGYAYVVGFWTHDDPGRTDRDAIVFKVTPDGTGLAYVQNYGGTGNDTGWGVAVDSAGNAYISGDTNSTDFPTVGTPIQAAYGGGLLDAFVAKITQILTPTGVQGVLVYSTYLGGGGADRSRSIAVDSTGNAYVTGDTNSTNFPTVGTPIQAALGGTNGLSDVFVTKINTAGTALVKSTYFGGSQGEFGNGIAVDSSGIAYVIGFTASTDFPNVNPIQAASGGGNDAFVAKIRLTDPRDLIRDFLADVGALIAEARDTSNWRGFVRDLRSLIVELVAALRSLDATGANSNTAACTQLQSFRQATLAQSGRLISATRATSLINSGNQVTTALACP